LSHFGILGFNHWLLENKVHAGFKLFHLRAIGKAVFVKEGIVEL